MNVLLNGRTVPAEEQTLLLNRGFRYGDGSFETIYVYKGVSPLLDFHQKRLQKSMNALKLHLPQTLHLEIQLQQLTADQEDWQRVRLWVWRTGKGMYTPDTRETEYLMATENVPAPAIHLRRQAYLSQEVQLAYSKWSFVKSISALPYVLAGIEKAERKADELLLVNQQGDVTEATAANLFFKKRNRWYTPALSCGCIGGVMRSYLMQQQLQKGEPVFEVHAKPGELQNMDKLVCTNVGGLHPIAQFADKQFDTDIEELWSLLPESYQL